MSEIGDSILAAIDNGARDTDAIVEATGLEKSQVYTGVHALKKSSAIVKGDEGLVRSTGAASEAAPAASSPPPPKRKKRVAKAKTERRAKRKKVRQPATVRVPRTPIAKAAVPIPFARFGEYTVVKHVDLLELVALVGRWRPVVGQ